jgi:hypothetical protein
MARLAEQTQRLREQTELVLALSSHRRTQFRTQESGGWRAGRQSAEVDNELTSDGPELN